MEAFELANEVIGGLFAVIALGLPGQFHRYWPGHGDGLRRLSASAWRATAVFAKPDVVGPYLLRIFLWMGKLKRVDDLHVWFDKAQAFFCCNGGSSGAVLLIYAVNILPVTHSRGNSS